MGPYEYPDLFLWIEFVLAISCADCVWQLMQDVLA